MIKLAAGILLLPVAAGFLVEFSNILQKINYGLDIHPAFVYGLGAYVVIHILLYKPIMAYVFGHEITHALWAVIFGGKIKKITAGKNGGAVAATRSNIWIRLAPYFFPLYAYLILGLYGIFVYFDVQDRVLAPTAFLAGFTLSFHLIFTAYSFHKRQKDLKASGIFLSLVLILIFNCVFIALIFKILAPEEIDYLQFLQDSLILSKDYVVDLIDSFR